MSVSFSEQKKTEWHDVAGSTDHHSDAFRAAVMKLTNQSHSVKLLTPGAFGGFNRDGMYSD